MIDTNVRYHVHFQLYRARIKRDQNVDEIEENRMVDNFRWKQTSQVNEKPWPIASEVEYI